MGDNRLILLHELIIPIELGFTLLIYSTLVGLLQR